MEYRIASAHLFKLPIEIEHVPSSVREEKEDPDAVGAKPKRGRKGQEPGQRPDKTHISSEKVVKHLSFPRPCRIGPEIFFAHLQEIFRLPPDAQSDHSGIPEPMPQRRKIAPPPVPLPDQPGWTEKRFLVQIKGEGRELKGLALVAFEAFAGIAAQRDWLGAPINVPAFLLWSPKIVLRTVGSAAFAHAKGHPSND